MACIKRFHSLEATKRKSEVLKSESVDSQRREMSAEVIGIVASGVGLYAFYRKDERSIRIFSVISAIFWLIYGLMLGGISIVITNIIMITLNTFRLKTLFSPNYPPLAQSVIDNSHKGD